MLIQCKLHRPGGTRVNLETSTYHFKERLEDGLHVAMVDNPAHAATLLAIKEGYSLAPLLEQPEPDPAPVIDPSPAPATDPVPAPEAITDVPVVQPEPDGDDDLEDFDPEEEPAEEPDGAPEEGDMVPTYGGRTQEELIDEHLRLFGKAPHPATKPETLVAKIDAKLAENQ
ncbi:hypothetical protein [Mesobacterium pallidum]|uniref:hypothetical protein n=1 Tax=Mesobacterium pallidum TaxID=2872037 RepID=UPI001EE346EB|nr:hypothetical protein [Mesobacterium pallidum]